MQAGFGGKANPRNRSGIEVQPLYTPEDWPDDAGGERYMQALGFPGQLPMTRGIYPTMHRGRTWTQRQLIGLGVPEDYNARLKTILAHGGTAISLIPCNSVYRGYDADGVPPEILGTCGVTVNTSEDMTICLDGIPIGDISTALNDPSPFTLLALELAVAKRRGIPWQRISGTSNQSDYLSHFVANHMFFRLAAGLRGACCSITSPSAASTCRSGTRCPSSASTCRQAGATPAEAMGLTLSSPSSTPATAWRAAGSDQFLPRFTFFFDISVSFFEEVAKFRAGRRIWARLARERFGAKDARSWRFKFHGQTSGVDLTREQPLNNIARVTAQAMAGIFGGLQSLHTDAYDEVLSVPTEGAARIAVSTQNILKEEAYLTDVIDPLGGSYYVEKLTDQMEEKILEVIARIDEAGGMYAAVEAGLAQRICGQSALAFQERVDGGEQTVVGVNKYRVSAEEEMAREALKPPPRKTIDAQLKRLKRFKAERSQAGVRRAIDALTRAAERGRERVRKSRGGCLSRRDARRNLRGPAQGVRLRPSADRALEPVRFMWKQGPSAHSLVEGRMSPACRASTGSTLGSAADRTPTSDTGIAFRLRAQSLALGVVKRLQTSLGLHAFAGHLDRIVGGEQIAGRLAGPAGHVTKTNRGSQMMPVGAGCQVAGDAPIAPDRLVAVEERERVAEHELHEPSLHARLLHLGNAVAAEKITEPPTRLVGLHSEAEAGLQNMVGRGDVRGRSGGRPSPCGSCRVRDCARPQANFDAALHEAVEHMPRHVGRYAVQLPAQLAENIGDAVCPRDRVADLDLAPSAIRERLVGERRPQTGQRITRARSHHGEAGPAAGEDVRATQCVPSGVWRFNQPRSRTRWSPTT